MTKEYGILLTTNPQITRVVGGLTFLVALFIAESPWAQTVGELNRGVVKITSTFEGKDRVGTGIIVKIADNNAYIVTASHVIEGDAEPRITFFTEQTRPLKAKVLGLDGGNPKGLAALLVEGQLPSGLRALTIDQANRMSGGESVIIIGFPQVSGVPWAVTKGSVVGRKGPDIAFTGAVSEGNSGGPLLLDGQVVGVITNKRGQFAYAVPVGIVVETVLGWGVDLQKPKVGAPMVLVPEGEFLRGSPAGEGDPDERPQERVYLEPFYINKYEVTTAQYAEFLRATGRRKPLHWDRIDLSQHRNRPIVAVDWHDSVAYCEWAGKRLPTEAEWEKAARGTDGRTYPWGDEAPTQERANYGPYDSNWESNLYDVQLKDVGSYESGKSPYGIYDMAGNVREWVADWYEENYYAKSPVANPQGPSKGELKVLRGGSWGRVPKFLRTANRYRYLPSYRDAFNGLRCAKDAEK